MVKLKQLLFEGLKSVNVMNDNVLTQLANAAQKQYDMWEQDAEGYNEELGYGGICHLIADDLADVLIQHGIDCATVCSTHEQHVYLVCKFREGVYMVDIPYSVYETGGGFNWKKRKNVKFDSSHVVLHGLDRNPRNFEKYTDS